MVYVNLINRKGKSKYIIVKLEMRFVILYIKYNSNILKRFREKCFLLDNRKVLEEF